MIISSKYLYNVSYYFANQPTNKQTNKCCQLHNLNGTVNKRRTQCQNAYHIGQEKVLLLSNTSKDFDLKW